MEQHHQNNYTGVNFTPMGRQDSYQKYNRGSHSSDTSSAYSGSDTMTSVRSSLDADEVDLSGLVESVVDSDEEDLVESMDSFTVRDTVRECLEKDPSDRTAEDIEILLEFTQKLKAFTNMTLAVRRSLCSVMVFAVVEKAGTVVMNDGEELDSWSVLINGHVEVEHSSGAVENLHYGDSFGIPPTMDKLCHRGVMRTKCDDCQFVCITQTDYYRIQHSREENIRRHEENGRVVMVTELRQGAENMVRNGYVVIRGTTQKLMQMLVEENTVMDPTYIEDFLLTYRTFINNPINIAMQLWEWYNLQLDSNENEEYSPTPSTDLKERVARVVLIWVNNHFTDFETDPAMMEFLEIFETALEKKNMLEQLKFLHLYAQHNARSRNVILARSSRDEELNFQINGGVGGIFVTRVEKKTKAEEIGLKRGDQILDVNGQNFEYVTYAKALDILKSVTHLSITVKSNLLGFKEMILYNEGGCKKKVELLKPRISALELNHQKKSVDQVDFLMLPSPMKADVNSIKSNNNKGGFMTLGGKKRIQKALIKMKMLPKKEDDNANNNDNADVKSNCSPSSSGSIDMTGLESDEILIATCFEGDRNSETESNTPKTQTVYYEDFRNVMSASDYPEHILKVYKSDQTCKYLLIHKETTAHEVVMLALQEFGIHESSSNFSLCEVSVGEGGMIKQSRLPDQLQNLAERIGMSSRYYLKTNGITETLVPDDMGPELIRESIIHFLQLNANELAIQLTLQDFAIFRQIESTEYIDDLFSINSKYGVPMLHKFSELVNKEMFWVVTEVCSEVNVVRRSKILKQFIKIARHCKECKNFNSMFAIISGLGHASVSRLRTSWEKLPSKYQKLFTDLQDLMDPSRNMSKYRQMIATELILKHPLIPFYPVVKKDMTFIHLGNDTIVENLINFEKLRMISKEIRNLNTMCNSQYDIITMLEQKGTPPSSAMVALNQMAVQSPNHIGTLTQYAIGSQQTVKRRKKSTAAPNPKKMFEEAQMVRRVKTYLNNMKIITDEDTLHKLSLECEPSGGSAPNSVQIRKRNPSPTLSTTSSTSSTSEGKKGGLGLGISSLSIGSSGSGNSGGPKFGAASPQAVKKILSLSEQTKTRLHQPRHSGVIIPNSMNNVHYQHPFLPHHHHIPHHPLHHSGLNISPSPSPYAHHRIVSANNPPNYPPTNFGPPTVSPTPPPYSHHRIGSAGTIQPYTPSNYPGLPSTAGIPPYMTSPPEFHLISLMPREIHPNAHPEICNPRLPSVDLSAESSSVTSLNNIPFKKNH